jgi:hypothetical protein
VTLAFDSAAHRYFWNGKPVPNVTSILKPLTDYSMIPRATLEKAQQEGQAVHKMIELDCAGTLDREWLPGWMESAYGAWCDFKAASGFTPLLSEHKGYHPGMRYAGTLDLVCELPRLKDWKGVALLDVKRSLFAGPVIGLQLAAYKGIVEADKAMPKIARRGALRIGNDGKFQLEPFDDATDASTFLALLTLTRWKDTHGYDR